MAETTKVAKTRDHTKAPSLVLNCSCEHEFQDKEYGKGKRLHNPTAKGARCTVCGKDKILN